MFAKLKKDQLNFTCYTKDSLHKLKTYGIKSTQIEKY